MHLQVVQVRDVRFNILVNIALTLKDDAIPNVRLALCHLLDVLREHIVDHSHRLRNEKAAAAASSSSGSSCTDTAGERRGRGGGSNSNSSLALEALRLLLGDADRDVQYFAGQLRDHIDADYQQYRAVAAVTAAAAAAATAGDR